MKASFYLQLIEKRSCLLFWCSLSFRIAFRNASGKSVWFSVRLMGLNGYRIYVLGGQGFFHLCKNPVSVELGSNNTGTVIYHIYQRGPRPLSAKEADVLRPVVPLNQVLPCQWSGDLRAHQDGENRSAIYPGHIILRLIQVKRSIVSSCRGRC